LSDRLSEPLFDEERMRVYPRMALVAYALAAIALIGSATAMIDVFGKPLGYDFITFWGASHLTLQGDAMAAFDYRKILAAEQLAVPANTMVFLWHYPPIFQMFIAPLALLPYALSWIVFVGGGLIAYVMALRPLFNDRLALRRDVLFLLLAFPGTFICVFHGQNSLYTVALFVGGMLAMERGRPWLAGLALGFLIYKPQFGVLLPLVFLVSRQWRAFLATGIVALAISGIATIIFGPDLWVAFFHDEPLVRGIMESGFLPWSKMPSAFIFFRYLDVPQTIAYALQAVTAICAAGCAGYVWWRKGVTRLSWAVLIAATLLVPPYIFDYEFAILAPVIVILGSDMAERGARFIEKVALIALYALPVFASPIAGVIHLQVGFLILVLALSLAMYRSLAEELEPVLTDRPVRGSLSSSLPL